jgi:aminoglycoside phosphotransferase family enzyme
MNEFTVIGYFENNGQRYSGHHQGETWTDAVKDAITATAHSELVIVEVIAGFHQGLTEGECVESAGDWEAMESEPA